MTIHELEIGMFPAERRDSAQGALLGTWMDRHVLPAFAGRVLPIDQAVTLRSARLHIPDPQPLRDGPIAATALVHGMTVVTRNPRDFANSGAKPLNPWQQSSPQ